MKKKTLIPILTTLALTAVVTGIFGHACSPMDPQTGNGPSLPTNTVNKNECSINQRQDTASVVYSSQILDSFMTCVGLILVSDATRDVWDRKRGAISEFGIATTVTAPMLMSIASIAGEVCSDLVTQESPLPYDQRRLLIGVDFTAGPDRLSDNVLGDITRRIARSCWQRNEDSYELNIILENIHVSIQAATSSTPTETSKAILSLCTGMLSSLSSYLM